METKHESDVAPSIICTCEDTKENSHSLSFPCSVNESQQFFLKLVSAPQASSKCLVISQPTLESQQLFGFRSSAVVSSLGSCLLRNAPCYVD